MAKFFIFGVILYICGVIINTLTKEGMFKKTKINLGDTVYFIDKGCLFHGIINYYNDDCNFQVSIKKSHRSRKNVLEVYNREYQTENFKSLNIFIFSKFSSVRVYPIKMVLTEKNIFNNN